MNLNCFTYKIETFTCKKCNLVLDRDVNGARNILIKNIKEMDENQRK